MSATRTAAKAGRWYLLRPRRRWRGRGRRVWLWAALVLLLLVGQSMLVWLTLNYESTRLQEQVDAVGLAVTSDVRQGLGQDLQSLQSLLWNDPPLAQWRADASELLRTHRNVLRVERRQSLDAQLQLIDAVETPFQASVFGVIPREQLDAEALLACTNARRLAGPAYSSSYFVPLPGGHGLEVIDVCVPVQFAGAPAGYMTATISLANLLNVSVRSGAAKGFELSFVDNDGSRLARAGAGRGAGVFVAERLIDLPGTTMKLRADSVAERPRLIPNLAVAVVLGLSLGLASVVVLLVRDVRRRAVAEAALSEALAFRKAMEDSLVTGLRARDLDGRVTYVNPAFCRLVGFSAPELIGLMTPPYWPRELVDEYTQRQAKRLGGNYLDAHLDPETQEGFETIFVRSDGRRIAVLIFEAPLVNGEGRHTGWMSAVLDVSEQRRVEELSRQQQERLAATARLATVGEMASLLSHELNQPLAAIASYATGSLNLLAEPMQDEQMLKVAIQRIAEQAERAGQVIKSVHDFVRRREHTREPMRVQVLVDAVLPLVQLQARKSGARIVVEIADPLPRVMCDRTMVEQVLLNLTRNGIQAMDGHTPHEQRELRITIQLRQGRWLSFHVFDQGPGVAPDVAQRLFTPFFTTRSEGMGLGLSLCRTVIEQHGGRLDFQNRPEGGAEFLFTLPAEDPAKIKGASPP
ncbi:MAG: ATP-binding protein [Pseudomonadota bacterium]